MSYTKTTWTKGDVITAEKLNKIESGIEQASSGGGEGHTPRIIELALAEQGGEPTGTTDTGLDMEDFVGAWVKYTTFGSDVPLYYPVIAVGMDESAPTPTIVMAPSSVAGTSSYIYYDPSDGSMLIPNL